jgi:hypothetical protein
VIEIEKRVHRQDAKSTKVCFEQINHDSGSRSSKSPSGGRSNSPCQPPAVARRGRMTVVSIWVRIDIMMGNGVRGGPGVVESFA